MKVTSSIADVVKQCKIGGALKIVLSGILAGAAAKLALDGAMQYGYGMGAEQAGESAFRFIKQAQEEGLDDDAIERCCEATHQEK